MLLELGGGGVLRRLIQTRFDETSARLSPDGRWMAYVSDESGRAEAYVQPFPVLGPKWRISTDGGTQPVWARDGRELYFRGPHHLMSVRVQAGDSFSVSVPEALFEDRFERPQGESHSGYDVAPDGRFLMIQRPSGSGETDEAPIRFQIVLNWVEELKEKVPVP